MGLFVESDLKTPLPSAGQPHSCWQISRRITAGNQSAPACRCPRATADAERSYPDPIQLVEQHLFCYQAAEFGRRCQALRGELTEGNVLKPLGRCFRIFLLGAT